MVTNGLNVTGVTTSSGGFVGNLTGTATTSETIDITNTNGLTTIYYPTFVENRTTGQYLRADVDLTYRTDTNTLTVGGGFVGNLTGTATTATTSGYATSSGIATYVTTAGIATYATGMLVLQPTLQLQELQLMQPQVVLQLMQLRLVSQPTQLLLVLQLMLLLLVRL
jgi:hypothetical protein